MLFQFKLPDIGEGVVEGEVIAWLKKEGDPLAKDEPVVSVMTDKATVELPTPYAGKLTRQFYRVGEMAQVNQPLFEVETVEHLPERKIEKPTEKDTVQPAALAPPRSPKALAAPAVRKLSRAIGIDLEQVSGTGPQGRITAEDLRSFSKSTASSVTHLEGDQEIALRGIQNLMAKKMVESARIIPHFSYFDQADATRLIQLHTNLKPLALSQGIKLTFMPFFIRALSLTLQKFPNLNSSVDPEKNSLILHTVHNIGIAMSTPEGLIVPNLKGVEKMGLNQAVSAYEELKAKAQTHKLTPADMKGGTISITNFGALGGKGMFATPLINYPEAAILGIARIHKEPIAVHDKEEVRDVLNCSWSFDHRIIDGEQAAKASSYFTHLIENCALLL
jgi:pyruvate/2-oxoglutarate dehydrogenase complex dihydrolipoamide acyltransferase (E2) component